jgi:hypothetical protein
VGDFNGRAAPQAVRGTHAKDLIAAEVTTGCEGSRVVVNA